MTEIAWKEDVEEGKEGIYGRGWMTLVGSRRDDLVGLDTGYLVS